MTQLPTCTYLYDGNINGGWAFVCMIDNSVQLRMYILTVE